MAKIDFKKQISAYRAPHQRFEVVTVPQLQFLMLDGRGDPNTSAEYSDALATIYPVAYRLKFLSKNELGFDYTVMPLEGQWWASDMAFFTRERDKSRWRWTVMVMVPDHLTRAHFESACSNVEQRGGAPALNQVRLESFDEGLAVQTLHIGPYDAEGPILAAMHDEFIASEHLQMRGKHHEIYLSDPRRTAPEKLRTILRQPVAASPARTELGGRRDGAS